MPDVAKRFAAKVDRSGMHHLWLGAHLPDGTGQLRVDGKVTTARRVAWELEFGPLPVTARVGACPDDPACVRVDHLTVSGVTAARPRKRAERGSGSKKQIRPGVWKLTVTAGRYADGKVRREHRTVRARTAAEASRELAEFVVEVAAAPPPNDQTERDITVDDAVDRYLTEHLQDDKGREVGTIREYRGVHQKWFSPEIGSRRVRDVDAASIERIFGRMRRAGLSASRMQAARNLYSPFFRWARRRRIIRTSPMAEFELPTSTHITRERVPPEVHQLCLYLRTAVEVIPDVAPVLTLGAVTGMRRGELVSIRRSRLNHVVGQITVDAAADGERIKATKTRKEREVALDADTVAMLVRHCDEMDGRAHACGTGLAADAFVFSLQPDCSAPMPADYVTRRVAVLKEYLGISTKQPDTIELEDEALRLYRRPPEPRPPGKRGPAPTGGLSFTEIGRRLGRSGRWAKLAVDAAQRREATASRDPIDFFDGSILALRKFTSSELLDAGFNISMVARRQGHGPQVLVRHYAKGRASSDRKAADYLGEVVHGQGRPRRALPRRPASGS